MNFSHLPHRRPGRPAAIVCAALKRGLLLLALAWQGLAPAAPATPATPATSATPATPATPAGPLHAPAPDWRDQILYFTFTDRFDDGDARNNDPGQGTYDPRRPSHHSGGDLKGLLRRLDYVRGLGATGLWITPPVANRWWDGTRTSTSHHGYWAEDFTRVDAHLGSLKDMQALARGLHARGMTLVQDIVLNHTGDYFHYRPPYRADDVAANYTLNPADRGRTAPTQPPFHLNDARNAAHRRAGIYHFTPDVSDYTQRAQELNWQMSGLDDLNSEHPTVRRALRRSYGHWIMQAGVDAFRLDTAFYVPPEALVDFMQARDRHAPGMHRLGKALGRPGFFVFGEGFGVDLPFENKQAQRIESYMHGPNGRPVLPGMLNFPLYGALNAVLARGQPTAVLGHRIRSMMATHPRVHWMPSFIDNHDVDRFLKGGDEAGLRQALLAMFTLPGIPVIYYGTEQGFTEPRASMFAAGWGSQGRDHFNTAAPLYQLLKEMSALRRGHKVFSRGAPTVLRDTAAGPGALAYTLAHAGERWLVVLNTAAQEVLLDGLALGSPQQLQGRFGLQGVPPDAGTDEAGRVSLLLPPRSGQVWRLQTVAAAKAQSAKPMTAVAMRPAWETSAMPAPAVTQGFLEVTGTAAPGQALQLVLDGDLAQAQPVQADAQGRFHARIDTGSLIDPAVRHRLVAWHAAGALASEPLQFNVQPQWQTVLEEADPAGDDHGPSGQYRYPLDPSWGDNRQADIRRFSVRRAGNALQVEVQMASLSRSWNPANGFDHVAFTLFIELPGVEGGQRAMPLQHAELPGDMRWHLRLRAHGWSNALFDSSGAGPAHEGQPRPAGAHIEADAATATLRFTLPASVFGTGANLQGARLYLNTWDYDAGYRALQPQSGRYEFGGGQGRDALWMDSAGPFRLP